MLNLQIFILMTINELIERGSMATNIPASEITGTTRKDEIVIIRHAISAIAYKAGYNYRQIAQALNRRCHATVINSCRRSGQLTDCNRDFRELYNLIQNG